MAKQIKYINSLILIAFIEALRYIAQLNIIQSKIQAYSKTNSTQKTATIQNLMLFH